MTGVDRARLDALGFDGPFDLYDAKILEAVRPLLANSAFRRKDRHVDCAPIRNVFFDKQLHSIVCSLSDRRWLLWRSNFFQKESNAGEIGWHHDKHFQAENQQIDFDEIGSHLSILIAMDDMHEKNGALEIIPRSHRSIAGFARDARPFHMRTLQEHFLNVPNALQRQRTAVSLRRGQFLLFHSALLHRSLPYFEGNARISMIGRLVSDGVQLPEYISTSGALLPLTETVTA